MRARGLRRWRHAASVTLLLSLLTLALPAAADPFTVRGVRVDETAETAAAARDRALVVGQRQAFDRLLERLVVADDLDRLPALSTDEVLRLVDGIQVSGEKSSASRYIAELIVSFRRERVRELLRANGVRFAETPAKPVLVLPVLEEGGERRLFDDENPWRDAWLDRPVSRESLLPLQLPLGDLADVATIGPNEAAFGEERHIQRMAERYEVDGVIVALARIGRDYAVDRPYVDISLRRYGGVGARLLVERFDAGPDETLEALLARAVDTVSAGLEEDWKQETALAFGAEQLLSVQVPLAGFEDWRTIRQRLLRNAMIRRVEILAIRRGDAQLALEFSGLPSQLQVAQAQDDLELRQVDGFWRLGLRGRNPAPVDAGTTAPADSEAAAPAEE